LSCEICGNPITGKGKKILISGAILTVCDNCAKHSDTILFSAENVHHTDATKNVIKIKTKTAIQRLPKNLGKEADYEIVDDYAKIIKNARESMGWTVDLLAEQVREKVSVIKKIESGKIVPSINLAKRLEQILGIKLLEPMAKDELQNTLYYMKYKKDENITLGDVAEIKFKNKKNGKQNL